MRFEPHEYSIFFQSGFTLIEMIMGMVVMSIAFAFMETALFPLYTASVDPMLKIKSVELGQAYIEEILGKRFDDNSIDGGDRCGENGIVCTLATDLGNESGETRLTYDDVDDYDGLDSNNEGGPQTAMEVARQGFANYRVQIAVVYDNNYDGVTDLNTQFLAKLITVTVTDPQGDKTHYAAYRGNF